MHQDAETPVPRKPILVFGIAGLFLLAPFGNFLMSLILQKVESWYHPVVWTMWIPQISLITWFWSLLIFGSGCALLWPRKGPWLVAMIILLLTIPYNIIIYPRIGEQAPLAVTLGLIATCSILIVLYFFRYPYLDRRGSWWTIAPRYVTNLPVRVTNYEDETRIVNLSKRGALIRWTNIEGMPSVQDHVQCIIDGNLFLPAQVVWKLDLHCGVYFEKLSHLEKIKIRKLIANIKEQQDLEATPVESSS